jgi:hypothetical protein
MNIGQENTNRNRIDNIMVFKTEAAYCPNCNRLVYPKFYDDEFYLHRASNLWWCNKCLKGKAAIFWRAK